MTYILFLLLKLVVSRTKEMVLYNEYNKLGKLACTKFYIEMY
jgi:hypothetical protein